MQMSELQVIHYRKLGKAQSEAQIDISAHPRGSWKIETCQRILWVSSDSMLANLRLQLAQEEDQIEIYDGSLAYWFLLRVATGLASQVKGESDVFGQLKSAWSLQQFQCAGLRHWVKSLFEDTKDLRHAFFREGAGSSYGSAVRFFLRQEESARPLVMIGAGKIAQSIFPWIKHREVFLWNRSEERANEFLTWAHQEMGSRVTGLSEESLAFSMAKAGADLVYCIPPHGENDLLRVELLSQCKARIVHLGLPSASGTPWEMLPNCWTLQEVFQHQARSQQIREDLFLRAEQACIEKARLRELCQKSKGSFSMAHGWEDLALFHSIS